MCFCQMRSIIFTKNQDNQPLWKQPKDSVEQTPGKSHTKLVMHLSICITVDFVIWTSNLIIKHNIKYKSANEIKLVPSRIYSIYWDVASKTPVRIKTELIKVDRVARHRNTCHQRCLDKKHAMDQRCGCLKLGNLGLFSDDRQAYWKKVHKE